ncbi:unnamed protein product [Adineta steineri]|uniref:F-box domain-containing protein n=1 Tax=Adineta steineri TaxID=433720 RepID=A0A815V828_9BILA|nr:unnamed protein product [Adineta steineri]
MSSHNIIPSLLHLPVELTYRILDHLAPSDILVSVRDVCSRLNAITNIYPRFQTLVTLDLLSNGIDDDEGACCLADALKINQAITRLDLTRNNIGPQGAQHLADALKINQTLKILSLSDNTIGEEGACYLSDALKINKTLVTLHLHGNRINDKGAQCFADMMMINQVTHNFITLTKLNLRSACIDFEGAQFLGDALRSNRTLTELDISFNRIGDDGAQYLGNGLKNNQVKEKEYLVICHILINIFLTVTENIDDSNEQY